jgi:purine-nucleoside phosphorylase
VSTANAIARSAERIRAHCGGRAPRLAVLLGSGWGALAGHVRDAVAMPYAELPAFPVPAVPGHAGKLLAGSVGGRDAIVLCGRKHAYEHGDASAMSGAVRTLAACGVEVLVQTSAAGSLHAAMRPGALMMVADHLNLVQRSPLVDASDASRFVDLRNAYDARLRAAARAHAQRSGIELHEGVYAWMLGPQFETPAEIRMLQRLGADAVGMSTVPETIAARQAGLRVLAFSLITNMGCGLADEPLSHAHTIEVGAAAAARVVPWLESLVGSLET